MSSAAAKRVLRVAAALATELDALALPLQGRAVPVESSAASGDQAIVDAYELLINDDELRSTTRALFRNRHWAQSVEEGFKYVNSLVKHRSGLSADGADLMRRALSLKDPTLKLSPLKTQSQKDQRLGYMEIMAGAMTGVRNPRAHEHRYLEDPRVALEVPGESPVALRPPSDTSPAPSVDGNCKPNSRVEGQQRGESSKSIYDAR